MATVEEKIQRDLEKIQKERQELNAEIGSLLEHEEQLAFQATYLTKLLRELAEGDSNEGETDCGQ